jgi:O-antigen ligase
MLFLLNWNQNKLWLVAGNILLGIVFIALTFTKTLPLDPINFIFFSFVGFLLALYRPGWMFLLLIGMLPYEIVNLAPESFGIAIRPYQWLLVLILLSLIVRFIFQRFPVQKFVPNFWDILLIIFGVSSFLSALTSPDRQASLKLSLILFSFMILYFLCRIFIHSLDDVIMILPFLFSSFLVVAGYAILQNILFSHGWESLEVMIGRPNATFAEADWLGGYLAIMITTISALLVFSPFVAKNSQSKIEQYILSALLFFGFTALIVSVSRSAWLAAFAGIIFALSVGLYQWFFGRLTTREAVFVKLRIVIPLLLAFFAVYTFQLTPFNIFDRGQSVTSGKQKITIACAGAVTLPETINNVEELTSYNCEHIRLEEISHRKAAGEYVTWIFRSDPNINIRRNIYEKSFGILKEHWFFGIGFGTISEYLGIDGRGMGLNASNIFLEVWLGSGIIGFLTFAIFWFGLGWKWLYKSFQEQTVLAVSLGAVWITATVFNLFNSGLFLGWFFAMLAFLLVSYQNLNDNKLTFLSQLSLRRLFFSEAGRVFRFSEKSEEKKRTSETRRGE